jgi:thiosulfate dehydrogenase
MKKSSFLVGLIVGVLLIPVGLYFYFAGGYAPVATSASPMPFEAMLAKKALHARMKKETLPKAAIEPTEANLMEGLGVYKQHCAVCHGLPGEAKTAIAEGMFPRPPQLFHGKGVTDDPVEETYWLAANGIRLSGMPGFTKTLSEKQLWQVSFLLAKANELPASVKSELKQKEGRRTDDQAETSNVQPSTSNVQSDIRR